MLLLVVATARAAVTAGVAWVPAGIGALAWTEADQLSGTLVGEFDGLLRPPLTVHAGWTGGATTVVGGAALAILGTERFAESSQRDSVGALRLGLDYRRYLESRQANRVGLYGTVGGYGIVPFAEDVDDAYTADEAAEAAEAAEALRARVGGIGAQLGLGAEYVFPDAEGRPAVALGVRYLGRVHRAQAESDDEGLVISTAWMTEAALVLEFVR